MVVIKRHGFQEDGPSTHHESSIDDRDMQRMALPAELRRRFKLASVIGFACISGATWEWALVSSQGGLTNGGSGGVIWIFLAVMIGMFTVVLSMAEMASIAPSAAGQYMWVSELGPPGAQRLLSYFVGWFAAIGWQGAAASNPLVLAQHVEALVALNNPTFEVKGWMTSLLMIACAALATCVNIYGIRFLSSLEAIMLALHVVGFFAVLIPLWLMGERSTTRDVFFTFEDNAGWGSIGTACLVGLLGPIMTLIGGDSTVHLGEEIRDASRTLPLSMVFTSLINYAVGFIMTITVMYVSSTFDQKIADATGETYVTVIYAATGSKTATTILTVLVLVLFFCTAINTVTTSSRQLFAFARDGGLPFSNMLAKVDPRTGLPINALLTTFGVTFVLSWIICGFDTLTGQGIPRALPAADVLVDVSERQLLQYYSEVISASRVYVTGDENPFCSLTMPIVCTRRGPLLYTLLALSAAEMASSGNSYSNQLMTKASTFYDSAINQLQLSLANSNDAEENILTCVLLSSFEISNGQGPAWLQHLNGAVAIHNHFAPFISRECALFAYQYFSFRWILLETTMPPGTYPLEEVTSETSMTARLLQNLSTMLQQTIDTVPTVAMQSVDNKLGCSLEYLQLVNRISTLSALKYHRQADKTVAEETSDLYSITALAFDDALSDMVFVAKIRDYYLEHSSQCFKLAGRVYLRLICLDASLSQMALADMQTDLLKALRLVINEDQQRRAFPMWPLFIAGCASFEDEHRKNVLDMFRTLERKWPISNISYVRNVTTHIWQSRDLNGVDNNERHDWQTLITTFGWKLALS
ncbi:putative amino acid permease, partial [Aureobasidium melanogenum]